MLLYGLFACSSAPLDPCACPTAIAGHAVTVDDVCSCLPHLPSTPLPENASQMEVMDGAQLDWEAIDDALVNSDVVVTFRPGDVWDRIEIQRTDTGPNRLVLDGGMGSERAIVRGVLTPFGGGPRHRVTVRGFEITGSRDKGVYWESGDDVLLEDLIVHDNRGTPSINLEYSNRTGQPSTGFTIRNSHVYDQVGECIYIGGSEGEDAPSHSGVVVENNLVHDCRDPFDTKHDGINVKDRLTDVVVRRNVVLRTDWGIEVASPGLYEDNLVIDTDREGFQISDAFNPIGDMVLQRNTVLRSGHDGISIVTGSTAATNIAVRENTVVGASRAGILLGTQASLTVVLDDNRVFDSRVGFRTWGPVAVETGTCVAAGNDETFQGAFESTSSTCTFLEPPNAPHPAGPDGQFFSGDELWL